MQTKFKFNCFGFNGLGVISLATVVSGLSLNACDRRDGTVAKESSRATNGTTRTPAPSGTPAVTPPAATTPTTTTPAPAPDNTARNERDRNMANPTPIDQGESAIDLRITADIRKAVLAEKGFSVNAQNCKIITRNGIVTLRGPVSSSTERDVIETRAKAIAGVTSVVNELEVTPK